MGMPVFYPDLKIVPIAKIKLQEHVHKARMRKLAGAIKKEGILRNPPIVTNFTGDTYLHLDGANRITAAELLHYPNCLVQIVDYSDPSEVRLTSWSHMTTVDKEGILKEIRKLPKVIVSQVKSYASRSILQPRRLCVMVFSDSSVYEVSTESASLLDLVRSMGAVVGLYGKASVERVFSESSWNNESVKTRFARYPEHNVFIDFPVFSPGQVIVLVDRGVLLPAGITRHVVYRRKLNVNMPLEYLTIESLEKANEKLQKFLQHRTVRLYEEPIIYFE